MTNRGKTVQKSGKTWKVLILLLSLAVVYVLYDPAMAAWENYNTAPIFYGSLTIKLTESSNFDGLAETTSNPVYTAYRGALGAGVGGSAVAASGTTFTVDQDDNGIIYMRLHGGDSHYIAYWNLMSQNAKINSVEWTDLDDDGKDDLVVAIDVSSYKIDANQKPDCQIFLPLIDEDVSGLTLSAPDDVTSIGTTQVNVPVTHILSGLTLKSGTVIDRIYVTTNVTREGEDIKIKSISLSGLGLDKTLTNPTIESNTYTAWFAKPSDQEVAKGIMVLREAGKADQLYISMDVECTFEASEAAEITLNVEVLDTDGATVTLTPDTVVLSA